MGFSNMVIAPGTRIVRSRIPTNHNPFYYYDKSLISIDTSKQDAEYRAYLGSGYPWAHLPAK
ncbi:MAG: hypothetical protein WCR46_10420 [Deltaproteobacteria bacterium]|jgi:hypothetical protein